MSTHPRVLTSSRHSHAFLTPSFFMRATRDALSITVTDATGNTLHADPVATGTAVTG